MAELTPLYMDIDNVYSGDELGLPWRDVIGEGIVGAGDLAVTQNHLGADLSVDIAAGAAWVLGDTNPDAQPVYRVRNDAVVNKGISPDASNPRKVIIVAQITDETFAGVGRTWEILPIHGAPSGAPVEPALPDSALKLAVIDVAAGATSIVDADITDTRTQASVGGGQAAGGSGGGPNGIDLRNPGLGGNAGNCFPTVRVGTAWEIWHWEFVKDVQGVLYGITRAPAGLTSPKVRLALSWDATTGVSRFYVQWAAVADGELLDFAAFDETIAAQDIAVPATARTVKYVDFTLGSVPAEGDTIAVQIVHDGAHANDTVAVNSELLGAWLLPS